VNVARRADELEPARRAVALGTFDGVHLGHRRVIEAAQAATGPDGLRSSVVTFEPHPRTVLGAPVQLLTTTERRLELLAELGVDDVLLLRFDEELASLTPEAFAESVLRTWGAEVVAAGDGFRFGHGRSGDLELLERLGFDVRRVPLVESVSSSHIRKLVASGDVEQAARLLGRPVEVEGTVVHGHHRGGELGFPTANLDVPADLLIPAEGVYAGAALGHPAAISIGTNPHFGGDELVVEAFVLDYVGDLYTERLVVEIWERLRDQSAFASEAELVAAIDDDVARTRAAVRPGS
jgi:riboflavin kinase/FMN adenylyltransferase